MTSSLVHVFDLLMSMDTCHLLLHDVVEISDTFEGCIVGGDGVGLGEVGDGVKS